MKSAVLLLVAGLAVSGLAQTAQRARQATTGAGPRTITVVSEPKAVVWIDEVRRGTTDATGRLAQLKIGAGRHALRVRANGFKEVTMPITTGGDINVRLVRTTDNAELLFQQA